MRIAKSLFFILVASACSLFTPGSPNSNTPTPLPGPGVTTIPAPDPDETARAFLQAWKDQDYGAMYARLSPLTQDGIDFDTFQDSYLEIKQSAALTGIDFQIVSSLVVSPQTAEVRFRTVLRSAVVGEIEREISMNLTRVEDDWRVAWTRETILPELTDGRGLRLFSVTPTRANIYDRNGLALATQGDTVALWIVPNQIGDEGAEETMLSTLRRLLDLPSVDELFARYDLFRQTDFYTPVGEVGLDDFQQVQGVLGSVGGVLWRSYPSRFYLGGGLTPYSGGLAQHAIGYVGQIQEEELELFLEQGYQGDEYVGQIGLEFAYEQNLRGVPGGTLYLTDPNEETSLLIASRDPSPPYAVYTTIDRELQRHATQAIENFAGAIVVLERDTGAVLAMASSPGFDPNLFDTSNPNSGIGLGELFNDPETPFLNRATSGLYPAGSIFKIITMAAALESEEYFPEQIYNCGLEFTELPGITLYDWRFEKELPAAGEITLKQGLERSCNPWFYRIGLGLFNKDMPTAIPDMAKAFGLGQKTGIEIGEANGLVPDPENKLELLGEEWAARDSVQLAIGQSYLQVTPLQVARYVSAIGNGGTLYRAQIVSSIQNAEGEVSHTFSPEIQDQLPIREETLRAIQEAMVNVVIEPKATAYRKFLGLNLNVAGKTGTASTDREDPHAWFAGYTFEERDDLPDITVVVLLEYQGEGSDWAAPVFRRIVEAYFKGRPVSLYPWEARIRIPRTPTPEPDEVEADATPAP